VLYCTVKRPCRKAANRAALYCETALQVITFDQGGVSGHRNHIACYRAAKYASRTRDTKLAFVSLSTCMPLTLHSRYLVQGKQLPDGVVAMALETTGTLRKYTGMLDCFASSLKCVQRAHRQMAAYQHICAATTPRTVPAGRTCAYQVWARCSAPSKQCASIRRRWSGSAGFIYSSLATWS
jgi:LmbE family N-acetylglucosaminyl deacetylase